MALQVRKTRLGYWRKVRGLSQEEVASLLKVTARTVRNWEAGMTTPTPAQARILANLLCTDERHLFPYTIF